jgi:hypothetical protein
MKNDSQLNTGSELLIQPDANGSNYSMNKDYQNSIDVTKPSDPADKD